MSLTGLMPHTVSISRVSRASDGEGGWIETWNVAHSSIIARIRPLSASEIARYLTVEVEATHIVYFAGAADVKEGDKIGFGARTFLVTGVRNIDEVDRLTNAEVKEIC